MSVLASVTTATHASPSTSLATSLLLSILLDRLSQNEKVRLMSAQPKHDQISVSTVDAMRCVYIVLRLRPLRSNEVQDLVLAFSWHERVGEYNLEVFPSRVVVEPFHDVKLECF